MNRSHSFGVSLTRHEQKKITGGLYEEPSDSCTADCGGYTVTLSTCSGGCSARDTSGSNVGGAWCLDGTKTASCDYKQSTKTS